MYFKILSSLLFLSAICADSFCQDLNQQFNQAFKKSDTTAEIKILSAWDKTAHNDPARYVALFNYDFNRALMPVLSLTTTPGKTDGFVLKDKNNKTAGYLGTTSSFNDYYLDKALKVIDSAITLFPNRLDMRFGKVYLLGRTSSYDKFAQEIVNAVDYGQSISNKWLWRDGKPLDDPDKFILSTVQSYMNQLFKAGDTQTNNMRLISQAVLKYYPDSVETLSDLAVAYMIDKQYDKALPLLLKAEKIAPQDYIVLNNIGYCYELQKDKVNAIKYYELVKKYGSDNAKQDASKKIDNLNKKDK